MLPAWFLRLSAPVIAAPLTQLFNQSIRCAVVPQQWKAACTTVRDWTLSCAAPSDMVTVLKTLQQSVTCLLLLMNLCSSICSTMIYMYCNRYYLLKPVSFIIYVLVTTTDNYLESLLTLTTLASSPECFTLTHINCLLLSFTLTFISVLSMLQFVNWFKRIYIHTYIHT